MATQGRLERFLAYSRTCPQRDLARDAREQPGKTSMSRASTASRGGVHPALRPLGEEGGFLVVMAQGRGRGTGTVAGRSWYAHAICSLVWCNAGALS